MLLAIVHSLQAFELELILGFPFRFYVFSTQIHWLLNQQPPQFSSATALSSMILFVMVPLIILQRRTVARRDYVTVGGRYKGHRQSLGKWRWPIFFCLLAVALLITLVPLLFLTLASFMARFGYFNVSQAMDFSALGACLYDSVFLDSLKNTLVLAGATAILSIVLFTLRCLCRHPDSFCRPCGFGFCFLAAVHFARDHSRSRTALLVSRQPRCCGPFTVPCRCWF